jgi:hypothetical protein
MLSPNAVDQAENEIEDTSLLRSQIAILEGEVTFSVVVVTKYEGLLTRVIR